MRISGREKNEGEKSTSFRSRVWARLSRTAGVASGGEGEGGRRWGLAGSGRPDGEGATGADGAGGGDGWAWPGPVEVEAGWRRRR